MRPKKKKSREKKWPKLKKVEIELGKNFLLCIKLTLKVKLIQLLVLPEDMMKTILNHWMKAEKKMKLQSRKTRIKSPLIVLNQLIAALKLEKLTNISCQIRANLR